MTQENIQELIKKRQQELVQAEYNNHQFTTKAESELAKVNAITGAISQLNQIIGILQEEEKKEKEAEKKA